MKTKYFNLLANENKLSFDLLKMFKLSKITIPYQNDQKTINKYFFVID